MKTSNSSPNTEVLEEVVTVKVDDEIPEEGIVTFQVANGSSKTFTVEVTGTESANLLITASPQAGTGWQFRGTDGEVLNDENNKLSSGVKATFSVSNTGAEEGTTGEFPAVILSDNGTVLSGFVIYLSAPTE